MGFEDWSSAFILIFVFLVLMSIPCTGAIMIGYRMISELGYFPSKTPQIQMGICLKLIALMAISFGGLIVFFRLFSRA